MIYLFRRAGFPLHIFITVFLAFPAIAGSSAPRGAEIPAAQDSLRDAARSPIPAQTERRAETPSPRGFVNDSAGVMDAETSGKLNDVLAELDAKAKAQVAVLTVKNLGGIDIETYAVETYKKWGLGDKTTNRGVLLLVAVEDRKARIEVGYGLEGILPDGLTGAIQDKYIIPYFRTGDYPEGIYRGTIAIAQIIAKDRGIGLSSEPVESGQYNTAPMSAGQKIFSFILFVLFIILAIRHPFLLFFLLNSGGSRSRGGFGGFGGGMSGGGGSSRSW